MRESQKKAIKKYKEKLKRLTLDFSPTEMELWEHIAKQPKKQTYIKDLIRKDMKRESGIYVIFCDSQDDYCDIKGFIIGTEDEAEKYCNAFNENCKHHWQELEWDKIEDLTK